MDVWFMYTNTTIDMKRNKFERKYLSILSKSTHDGTVGIWWGITHSIQY
jgi:hypothetical protein